MLNKILAKSLLKRSKGLYSVRENEGLIFLSCKNEVVRTFRNWGECLNHLKMLKWLGIIV